MSKKTTSNLQGEYRIKIGWREFLTNKEAILYEFDLAKTQGRYRPTETAKGRVAEGSFRQWLSQFLPKRYAVTSGYIISQGIGFESKLLHYDVIIYDAFNAPVLWVENNVDHSEQGKSRAIPAEHVLAVLEIKSSFNAKSCIDAKKKLWELAPLLEKVDLPGERYNQYLPPTFCMGIVFFEILEKDSKDLHPLTILIPQRFTNDLRGYWGGIILQAEGLEKNLTGRINFVISDSPIEKFGDLTRVAIAGNLKTPEDKYYGAMIQWTASEFATFAFDLIAFMNGTYRVGFVSSFHGLHISTDK